MTSLEMGHQRWTLLQTEPNADLYRAENYINPSSRFYPTHIYNRGTFTNRGPPTVRESAAKDSVFTIKLESQTKDLNDQKSDELDQRKFCNFIKTNDKDVVIFGNNCKILWPSITITQNYSCWCTHPARFMLGCSMIMKINRVRNYEK
jgi:hypothetical protein